MKTLIVHTETNKARPDYYQLDGDYSRFDNCVINTSGGEIEEALAKLLYTENESRKLPVLDKPTKDWDIVIHTGMIL